MPYLSEEERKGVNYYGNLPEIVEYVSELDDKEFPGMVNYINYLIVMRRFGKTSKCRRYFAFAGWVGTMVCCILEVYRRVIAPYEDEAIERNGDVT